MDYIVSSDVSRINLCVSIFKNRANYFSITIYTTELMQRYK